MDYFITALIRQLPGLQISVLLTIVTVLIGLPLGFVGGILLTSRSRWVRYPTIAVVEVFRGFPVLLTLYLVYYGLPEISLTLDAFTSAVVAFGLTVAGYTAEIFRAAISSMPKGQREAAEALALKPATIIRLIVIPHVMRVVVPSLIGIIVIAFQGTALAVSIGVTELTGKALGYGQVHFTLLPEISVAALLYLIITSLMTWMEVIAERRAKRIAGDSYVGRRGRNAPSRPVPTVMS